MYKENLSEQNTARLLRRLAVPSWCVAGSVAENAYFLAGRVREIALCLFESDACLNYTDADLPQKLVELPLSWHVHLPLDLDWKQGAVHVFAVCRALLEKCAFLHPHAAVLHPPTTGNIHTDYALLQQFFRLWAEPSMAWAGSTTLCVENLVDHDFSFFVPLIRQMGAAICLDIGHALAHDTKLLEAQDVLAQTCIIHCALCDARGKHLPLNHASSAEREQIQRFFHAFAAPCGAPVTLVLELFNWQQIVDSTLVLEQMGIGNIE